MVIRWGAFVLLVLGLTGLAWGIAELVDVADCTAGRRYCDTEPGKQVHQGRDLLLVVGSTLIASLGLALAKHMKDWRPTLGLSAGALVGSAVALSIDRESGIWTLVGILLAIGALIPIGVRQWMALEARWMKGY